MCKKSVLIGGMSVGSRGSIKVVSFKLWSMKNICERSFKLNIFCKIKFTKHVMNVVHFWRCSINKFLKEWDEMKNIKQMGKDYIIYIWLHLQGFVFVHICNICWRNLSIFMSREFSYFYPYREGTHWPCPLCQISSPS